MTRRPPRSSDVDQPEFSFEVPLVEPVNEGPATEAPRLNRKQRRRVQFRDPDIGPASVERAAAPAPVAVEAPKAASLPKVAIKPADARQPTPFERLLHEQLAPVFNLCLRLTQDAAMADDLAQEVFVRAAKNLPESSSEAPDAETLDRRSRKFFFECT